MAAAHITVEVEAAGSTPPGTESEIVSECIRIANAATLADLVRGVASAAPSRRTVVEVGGDYVDVTILARGDDWEVVVSCLRDGAPGQELRRIRVNGLDPLRLICSALSTTASIDAELLAEALAVAISSGWSATLVNDHGSFTAEVTSDGDVLVRVGGLGAPRIECRA